MGARVGDRHRDNRVTMSAAGTLPVDSCSQGSSAACEPLAGTAPKASAWIVLEEPGPWGRDALSDSPIPDSVVDWAQAQRTTHGVRTIAARHIGRRRLGPSEPRNVWLATTDPGRQELRHVLVDRLEDVCQWDLSLLADAKMPMIGEPVDRPIEFICTHSGRDACCAVLGRQEATRRPDAWECSHLGGHRFAATSLVLPDGNCFGRLGPNSARDTDHLRGATYLPADLQVAEIAVRKHEGLAPSTPLWTTRAPADVTGTADVRDAGTGHWRVHCEQDTVVSVASCHTLARETEVWRPVWVQTLGEATWHGR